MKVPISEVLFTRPSGSDLKTLRGLSTGQYDVRLGSDHEFGDFFSSLPSEDPTATGGWTKHVNFVPFDGPNPVGTGKSRHRIRFMGPGAARKNDHYFAAQGTANQYPLWSPGRAFNSDLSDDQIAKDVIVIIKDQNGEFHARWVPEECIPTLPNDLQTDIGKRKAGVWKLTGQNATIPNGIVAEIIQALREHHNVLLYGPPATGKSHLINEVQRIMQSEVISVDTTEERSPLIGGGKVATTWATFHQSYSYEDFLIGVRPDNSGPGGFSLLPAPGVLIELAEWARTPGNESLLVIDEINRGNVSRIFGEFITLMEPDKRLNPDGSASSSTVSIRLPFVGGNTNVKVDFPSGGSSEVPNPFTMPHALYTLATMNSVDKSVAPLDAALRRRFHVIELSPDFTEVRKKTLNVNGADRGIRLLEALNERVSVYLGRDFQFGQWYLSTLVGGAQLGNVDDDLARIWKHKIFPQLEEFFVGRNEQLLSVLGIKNSFGAVVVLNATPEQEELGGGPVVRAKYLASTSEIIESINKIISHK